MIAEESGWDNSTHQQTLPAEVRTGIPTHNQLLWWRDREGIWGIDNIIISSKTHYNIVTGDFNAKVGPGEIREICTGSYGIGTRNRRGNMLVELAERHKLKVMNTFSRSDWTNNGHGSLQMGQWRTRLTALWRISQTSSLMFQSSTVSTWVVIR